MTTKFDEIAAREEEFQLATYKKFPFAPVRGEGCWVETSEGDDASKWLWRAADNATIESVQILPDTTRVGQFRDRVAARRGHNIGVVAAGRRQLEYVFYALRDHHVRALNHHANHPARTAA